MEETKILGAGISGLTAAINLARSGGKVRIFERGKSVGMRFCQNFQGLRYIYMAPEKFMAKMGVRPKIAYHYFTKARIITRKRDITLDLRGGGLMPFVQRGGEGSLEHALCLEALDAGVEIEFSSNKGAADAKIIASGSSGMPDFAALGSVFEESDFPRDTYLAMFDDRYSPKGWYSYMIPVSRDEVEFVTCVSRRFIPQLAKLHAKALSERKEIAEIVGGKRKTGSFGGSSCMRVPKSAFVGGKYYVGEAAGFQDPYMGFGIAYAIRSGNAAAKAIAEGKDYDALWKAEFLRYLEKDVAYRLPLSVFGDRMAEMVMSKYSDGQRVDFSSALPEKTPAYQAAVGAAYLLERAKFWLTKDW
jgi:flavin-dependent dehydrogenase